MPPRFPRRRRLRSPLTPPESLQELHESEPRIQRPGGPPQRPVREHRTSSPPEFAVEPLRRTRPSIQALGEPHPGPPFLYALNLVAVAPWSHRTACSGEVSPSRAAMADELRAPDLPRPNPHLRWTTRATSILHGQTPAQAEPCSPQDSFSGRAPPRERAAGDFRRRRCSRSSWVVRSKINTRD